MVQNKDYQGTKIIATYQSSTLKKIIYDTDSKSLIVEFTKGGMYEYDNVPHETFTKINMAKSSGSEFIKQMKNYKYKKL